MTDFDPGCRAALDRFSVPALPTGFVAQTVRTATADRPLPPRRDPRGGWRRHAWLLVGSGALVLASATAAAAGMFGQLPLRLPDLTRVFAPGAPVAVAAGHAVRNAGRAAHAPAKPAAPRLHVAAAPVAVPPANDATIRREVVRHRLLAIRAERIAAGAPTRPLPPRASPDQIARRQAFVADHPVLAARLVDRLRARFRDRAAAEWRAGRTLRGGKIGQPASLPYAAVPGSVEATGQQVPEPDGKRAVPDDARHNRPVLDPEYPVQQR